MGYLEDELDRQKEENRQQHEQILALTAKLQDTEMKLHKVCGREINKQVHSRLCSYQANFSV